MPHTPPAANAADILWFLPTHGDRRYLGTEISAVSSCRAIPIRKSATASDLVVPLLPLKPLTGRHHGLARNVGPCGEIVANVAPPAGLRTSS